MARAILAMAAAMIWAATNGGCAAAGEEAANPTGRYAIAIHGGAGGFASLKDPEKAKQVEADMAEALRIGRDVLAGGGTSLDAVEQVIRYLEDNPRFNAGRGAVMTSAGQFELDASIMDGRTLACGAVGGVTAARHPITAARRVMERTKHVLLCAEGADAFARAEGLELVDPSYFETPQRREQYERMKREAEGRTAPSVSAAEHEAYGTVGCVALDQHGNLAAGTSTGGLMFKMPGRLGDSPIIAAGTYADNRSCAVSCTGIGEQFIRHAVAYRIAAMMEYGGKSLHEAAATVMRRKLKPDDGGLIGVSGDGRITMQFNTKAMPRGAADSDGRFEVRIFE